MKQYLQMPSGLIPSQSIYREAVFSLQPDVAAGNVGVRSINNNATLSGLRSFMTRYPGLPKRQPWAWVHNRFAVTGRYKPPGPMNTCPVCSAFAPENADLPRASFISYLTAPAIKTNKRMAGI